MQRKRRGGNKSSKNSKFDAEGATQKKKETLTFWLVGLTVVCLLLLLKKVTSPASSERQLTSERREVFLGSTNNQQRIIVIENFFPHDLAEKWKNQLRSEWFARPEHGISSPWQYATNNDGRVQGGNAKVRSGFEIEARRNMAKQANSHGLFSYCKFELASNHSLISEITEFMLRLDTRERVANALGISSDSVDENELSDLFITNFASGDFLSAHTDGNSGTYAFVASLADGEPWISSFGGGLSFFCSDTSIWCKTLLPKFNSVTFFKSRILSPSGKALGGPLHRVDMVQDAAEKQGRRRFGFTGWYRDVRDIFSDTEVRERNKMRGTA